MKRRILVQGLTTDPITAVGTYLINGLTNPDYHTFTALSAFASEMGISGLSTYIEQARTSFKAITIIVGVDQKGTSKEALEAILSLNVDAYIFYQRETVIFHPKLYFFEGDTSSLLIVGSSNLTANGLFRNVEAAVVHELAHDDPADVAFAKDIKSQLSGLFNATDPNLQPITTSLIDELVAAKIVPTEVERKAILAKQTEADVNGKIATSGAIKKRFPTRPTAGSPAGFSRRAAKKTKSSNSAAKTQDAAGGTNAGTADEGFVKVWEIRNVPGSSVQLTRTANTNPTGMLRLTQADYTVNGVLIDHTTYFRNVAFGGLSWVPDTPKTEIAIAEFEVIIKGTRIGKYPLKLRYKPSGEANQGNYTTGLSWGAISKTIQDSQLSGCTIRLYYAAEIDTLFRLEID